MSVAIVTGSAGLVGSACARLFAAHGYDVIGVDNDLRAQLFGPEASTAATRAALERGVPRYRHRELDVRDRDGIGRLFAELGAATAAVIHCAAQPSHDFSAGAVETDFEINARATVTLLEATRARCPEAAFVLMSTNKVYGDAPNRLPLVEQPTRFELAAEHPFHAHGIDESMSIDATLRSPFGASKLAADAMTQEHGRYFGMRTVCLRAGCVTGPDHAGTHLHGFLAYLVRCAVEGREYPVVGWGGKQVRDNLHAEDLARICLAYCQAPRPGEIYNVGGGRGRECSVREAIAAVERIVGRPMRTREVAQARRGDHAWYVTDMRRLHAHYPGLALRHELPAMLDELCAAAASRARS